MIGMDMLLASLTQGQLVERNQLDAAEASDEAYLVEMEAQYMRWLIEDLEKRINE